MNGKVIKLCDPQTIQIPQEFTVAVVDAQQVEQELNNLAKRYAEQSAADIAQQGDIVCCRADEQSYPDGREIRLYTALDIPGAQAAAAAVQGQVIGAQLATTLAGKAVQLTIQKIIRLIPAQVNDKLIAAMGIEGVSTVEAYRQHITAKKLADIKMENNKKLMQYIMDQMINGSAFDYDPAELKAELEGQREFIAQEYSSAGVEMPADAELLEALLYQQKQGWLAAEYCHANGIEIDKAAAEEEADQMLEMMAIMGEELPDRSQMVEDSMRNAYVMELFAGLDAMLGDKVGR